MADKASISKPERNPSVRAERLTEAALDLFAERGFAAVTIKDITAEIGVNPALIYYYFDGKEDLFRATIEQAVSKALRNYTQLRTKHDNPVARIDAWFTNNLQLSGPLRKLVKIMLDYTGSPMRFPGIDATIQEFYAFECKILAESIRAGVDSGIFKSQIASDRLAQFVSTHLDGLMVASVIRADFDLEVAMNDLKTILWSYLGLVEESFEQREQSRGLATVTG